MSASPPRRRGAGPRRRESKVSIARKEKLEVARTQAKAAAVVLTAQRGDEATAAYFALPAAPLFAGGTRGASVEALEAMAMSAQINHWRRIANWPACVVMPSGAYALSWPPAGTSLRDVSSVAVHGVDVDNDGRLTHLRLPRNNLSGRGAPSTIWSLPTLRVLDLSGNLLEGGTMPAEAAREGWEAIDLSGNGFVGRVPPKFFAACAQTLVSFRIANNAVSGTLSIGADMRRLRVLVLSFNRLEGPVEGLSACTALEVLGLSDNAGLEGDLGQALARMSNLTTVDVARTSVSGTLALGAANAGLVDFDCAGCRFGGPLATAELAPATNLRLLSLSGNAIEGPLGRWPASLRGSLEELRLDNNRFSGTIPDSIGRLTRLVVLHVHRNRLTGALPNSLSLLTRCTGVLGKPGLDFSHNDIDSELPAACLAFIAKTGSPIGVVGNENLEMPRDLGPLATLRLAAVDFRSCGFTGRPPSFMRLAPLLTSICLSDNHLTGPFPSSLGLCIKLNSIDVSWNLLHGRVPRAAFENLTNLEALDLSNNLFEELDAFRQFTMASLPRLRASRTIL